MAMNRDFIGRSFPPSDPYEVTRIKIKEFADAIGDQSPLSRDGDAARAAGYPDVIAPPTFPIVITMQSTGETVLSPDLGVNYAMVVHGQQRFEYARPLNAGDVVLARSTVTEIRSAGSNELLTLETNLATVDGEHVVTAHNTIVERGGAA